MDHLFVYGTLMSSFKIKQVLPIRSNLILQGSGTIKGELYDLGSYPGYVEGSGADGIVKGEVYTINNADETFLVLDEYEGLNEEPPLYIRKKKTVAIQNGTEIESWVYIYNRDIPADSEKIENGDYLSFKKKEK